MTRYGYGPGHEDQLHYAMHDRIFCRADCDRHPDVTRHIADQLARERAAVEQLTVADAVERAELRKLLGPAQRPPEYLPTIAGDRIEWRKERAPWWSWRRWARRTITRVYLHAATDPWGRPWCECGDPLERHAHMPGGTLVYPPKKGTPI